MRRFKAFLLAQLPPGLVRALSGCSSRLRVMDEWAVGSVLRLQASLAALCGGGNKRWTYASGGGGGVPLKGLWGRNKIHQAPLDLGEDEDEDEGPGEGSGLGLHAGLSSSASSSGQLAPTAATAVVASSPVGGEESRPLSGSRVLLADQVNRLHAGGSSDGASSSRLAQQLPVTPAGPPASAARRGSNGGARDGAGHQEQRGEPEEKVAL